MTKTKEVSLRQQVRAKAETKLKALMVLMETAGERVTEELETMVSPIDVMHMLTGSQTKTLHEKLVTELANELEADLVNLWNSQQLLELAEQQVNCAEKQNAD